MDACLSLSSPALTPLSAGLEEVCAAAPRDMAGALAFALGRSIGTDLDTSGRRGVLAITHDWAREYGRPYGPGLKAFGRSQGLLLVTARSTSECLWVMEQALRSGGADLVLGTIDGADLAQTRRLEFAARDGRSAGVLLRSRAGDLSAARRRWRVATLASNGDRYDERAPGRLTLRAELTRSRTERPGAWMLEQDDETHRLRLADRLAGDGLGAVGRTHVA